MKGYTREDKKRLCKKHYESGFDGFSLKDKIALAEWQVEILDPNASDKAEKIYRKWSVMLVELRKQELLTETEEILTAKGRIKCIVTEHDTIRKVCYHCNGTGKFRTSNSNICNICLGKGYYILDKPKTYDLEGYRKFLIKKVNKKLESKGWKTIKPLEQMDIEEIEILAFKDPKYYYCKYIV